jgi:hypothetical protein
MGAHGSKQHPDGDGGGGPTAAPPRGGGGIVMVVPASAAGGPSTTSASQPGTGSRGPSPLPFGRRSRSATPNSCDDPLLRHLADLQAQGPRLLQAAGLSAAAGISSRVPSSSAATKAPHSSAATPPPEPDSLLADLATAAAVSSDTAALSSALGALLTSYQAWHGGHMAALGSNQEYITRTIDAAEGRADKAVRHVQAAAAQLRALGTGLARARELPALLARLTAATEAMEAQLRQLEQRAAAAEDGGSASGGRKGGSRVT